MRPWVVALAVGIAGCTLFVDTGGFSSTRAPDAPSPTTATDDAGAAADASRVDGAPPSGPAYARVVRDDLPLAYFPLDETSGTTARDVIGGRDATWRGAPEIGAPGVVGRGVVLDGSTARLEMPVGAFVFGGRQTYSVELWLRADVVDDKVRRIFECGLNAGGYNMYFSDSFFLASRTDTSGGNDGYTTLTSPVAGALHHYVLTFDGTSHRVYRDGVAGEPAISRLALPDGADRQLVFGDSVGGQFFKVKGLIDEIAIYDRALGERRIRDHFEAR